MAIVRKWAGFGCLMIILVLGAFSRGWMYCRGNECLVLLAGDDTR